MLNPAEMNDPSTDAIVDKVKSGAYAQALRRFYGPNVFDDSKTAMTAISDAIATFESSPAVNQFSSKYDAYLAGKAALSDAESRGLALFNGKALCNDCHPSSPSSDGTPPLFTDFSYNNVGLPVNVKNRFFSDPVSVNPDGRSFDDVGLQKTTGRPEDAGRFKVPTLRNIAITAPYFHNGLLTSLEDAVQFYNRRDSGAFGAPEFPATTSHGDVGNLGLSISEVSDIVAFLKTLTDGYKP
jgi:cytochrome c peroxidase